jgi:FkbM family methyltransferase
MFLSGLGYRIEKIQPNINPLDVFHSHICMLGFNNKNCCFVQIGANDSISGDPIRNYIEKYQWSGLMIEPNPAVFLKLLNQQGKNTKIKLDNIAIHSTKDSEVLYAPLIPGHDLSGLGSFNKKNVLRQLPFGAKIEEIVIPCMNLHDCLNKNKICNVDVLQIDTEGYDYEIIKQIDFTVIFPKIINYEHVHLSVDDRHACQLYLAKMGYSFYIKGLDTMAVKISM